MWNPEVYDKFKDERSAPFFDLMNLVETKPDLSIIDLGCGTGELTSKFLDYFLNSKVLGIDSSAEMLEKSNHYKTHRLHFEQKTVEQQLESDEKFDLVFSNACLQWCENHRELFPKLISKINKGGQFVVQIPSNHTYIVHELLREIISQEPFKSASNNYSRVVHVLKIEDYAAILFENGGTEINVFEKVYPHVLENAEAVFNWASGTAMIPYIENLPENMRESFKAKYLEELKKAFPESPVFYPFKRIFMYAKF